MVLNRGKAMEADLKTFKKMLAEKDPSFSALTSLRSYLRKNLTKEGEEIDEAAEDLIIKKIRHVERLRANKMEEGVVVRKRKPGTGTRVVEKVPYRDTKANREKGLTPDKTYDRVVYKDAEYIEYKQTNMRRARPKKRKSQSDDKKGKKRNFWIEAMQRAKQELGAPAFVIVRKTVSDPKDEDQILGHRVHKRAQEIKEELKAAAAATEEEGADKVETSTKTKKKRKLRDVDDDEMLFDEEEGVKDDEEEDDGDVEDDDEEN